MPVRSRSGAGEHRSVQVLQVGWAVEKGKKAARVKVGCLKPLNSALNHLVLLTAQMAPEANTSPRMQLYLSFGKVKSLSLQPEIPEVAGVLTLLPVGTSSSPDNSRNNSDRRS